MKRLFLLASLLFASGCAVNCRPGPAPALSGHVTPVVWCKDWTKPDVKAWDDQIADRWPGRDVVSLFCHGGDEKINGKLVWYLFPDRPRRPRLAEEVADAFHCARPGALVVLVSCNHGNAPMHVADTAYATDWVWVAPGPDFNFDSVNKVWGVYVGNIWEFKVNPK